jgi:hypothetical protein
VGNQRRAQIDAMFAARYCRVIWHLDGQQEQRRKTMKPSIEAPRPKAKSSTNSCPNWPWGAKKALVWYLFPEGAVQFLDGGRLDLGVVRDSTLDSTNDYELFTETFASIANRSFSKGIWQVLSEVEVTGGSSATVTAVAP